MTLVIQGGRARYLPLPAAPEPRPEPVLPEVGQAWRHVETLNVFRVEQVVDQLVTRCAELSPLSNRLIRISPLTEGVELHPGREWVDAWPFSRQWELVCAPGGEGNR